MALGGFDPGLHHLAYAAIILGQLVQAVLFVFAGTLMAARLKGSDSEFDAAKTPFVIGLAVAVLLWLFGFMAIAGEWFQMWQSPTYNVQQTVFTYYMTIIVSGIYILQMEYGKKIAR